MTEPFSQAPRASPPPPPKNGRPAKNVNAVDHPVSSSHIGALSDSESPPGVPRWVKALGIIVLVALLAVAAMHLTGEGGGPATHDTPMHSVMLP